MIAAAENSLRTGYILALYNLSKGKSIIYN
jgi:hypothetical protein